MVSTLLFAGESNRTMKGELEALGEESEGVENISKMQGQILNMTGGRVNIFKDNGEFRSTYEIMDGIADVYDRLSDPNKASLLETIAGKNHANTVAALIQNWDTARKMVETAENAEGSAAAENEKYLDSLQGRLDVMTSSVQAFSTIVLDSSFLKGIVSGATEAIDVFSALIDTVGVFPTLLGAAGAGFSIFGKGAFTVDTANQKLQLFGQNLGDIKSLLTSLSFKDFDGFSTQFNNLFGSTKSPFEGLKQQLEIDANAFAEYHKRFEKGLSGEQLTSALAGSSDELRQYVQNVEFASQSFDDFSNRQKQTAVAIQAQNRSFKSSSAIIQEYNNGCRTIGMSQAEFTQAVSSTNPVMGSYLSSLNGARGTMTGYAASLVGATAKTVGLTVASTALNAVLTMGIGVAIGAVISGISSLINYYDDLADSVDASSSAFETANSTLMDNKSTFDSAVQSYDKLRDGINKITGENLSLSTEDYEAYQDAVNTIADSVPSMVAGFDAQGNAILNTEASVESLTKAYNDLIAAESKAFVEGNEEKGYVGKDKIMEDYIHDLREMQTSDIESYQRLQEMLETNDLDSYLADLPKSDLWNIRDRLSEMGMKESNLSDADNIAKFIRENTAEVRNAVNEQMTEYENAADSMKQLASSMLNELIYSSDDILGMDESIQNLMTQYIGGLDGAFFEGLVNENNGNKQKAVAALEEHVGSIVDSFKGLTDEQRQTISEAFDMQLDFASGDATMAEFADKAAEVDKIFQDIGLDEDARKEMMLSLGFEYNDDGQLEKWTSDYETALNRLGGDDASKEVQNWLSNLSGSDLEVVMGMELEGDETVDELQHLLDLAKALQGIGRIDIAVESDNIEKLNTALSESASATGLTTESMDALNNMYADIDGFDPAKLFERTANGIHLNANALREYQSAYEQANMDAVESDLQSLRDEYDRLTESMANASSPAETAMLEAQRQAIADEISNVADLAAQYDGLTSSYNKWLQAKDGAEQGDMYDAMYGGIESTEELYNQGLVGTNEFREYVQMMTDEDLSNATTETIMGVYEKGMPLMKRYFTESAEGVQNFLNDVQNLNSEWAHMNEDGSWEFNFGDGNDEDVAKALGISTEQVQAMVRKLNDYGFEVEIDSEFTGLEDLKTQAEQAEDVINDLAFQDKIDFDYDFNFNTESIDYLDEQITEAQKLLDQFRKDDGTIDLSIEGAAEAQGILATLMAQKESLIQPDIMKITVEDPSSEVGRAVTAIQTLYSATTERDINIAIGADASGAERIIGDIAGQLAALQQENPELYAQLGLDTSEFNSALATINGNVSVGATLDANAVSTIQTSLQGIDANILAKVTGIDTSMVDAYTATETTKPGTVNWDNNTAAVDSYAAITKTAVGTVNWGNNTTGVKTVFRANGIIDWGNRSPVNGTAHVNGTAKGHAFKQGDWSLKDSGTALVGELGQETVVRDGHFFTIGDSGAEFFNYKKGDIIFNHKQTEELFKNGYVTSGGGRGRAFAEGTAFSRGSGSFWGGASSGGSSSSGGTTVNNVTNNYNYNSSSSKKSSSTKSSSSKAKKEAEEFEENLDLIEIVIDRIERAIDSLDRTASSAFKSFTERTKAFNDEMVKTGEEIVMQQRAYDRYMQQAQSVGLSEDWQNKLMHGEIDIELITDENLKEQIDDFQEWYIKCHTT